MTSLQKSVSFGFSLIVLIVAIFLPKRILAESRPITFPVIGSVRYSDDFGAPRSGGRTHEGNDLLGIKRQRLVAAVDGTVRYVAYPEPDWGYAVFLEDDDGYEYWYLHMNNDRPGTDDDLGGGMGAYAPDMVRSFPVVKGQLIGWMGDSGNAEHTSPHLHFEIHTPDGQPFSPFQSLQAAEHVDRPVNPPALPIETLPYAEFQGGASVAMGEFDGNPATDEYVTGAGPGGGPQIRVFKENGRQQHQFLVYDQSNRNGLDVAAADINGDGIDEVITGPGPGGPPEVKIFSKAGTLIRNFLAYSPSLRTGITVAAADLNGDGKAEIITGLRAGGEPRVRVFSSSGYLRRQFFAYDQSFRGGIDVAATPGAETLASRIVTGAGPGGGPQVRVFTRFGTSTAQFFPYAKNFRGGVRVSIGNLDPALSGWEILTAPASRGGPDFKVYSHTGRYRGALTAFEVWWRGGYDVALGNENALVASGPDPRRTTIRQLDWD